ncbi:hypothetical protein FISHEDRAFT_59233 [Fistulina hepatica ATCC 64428]|uniref:Uncharacterized protein n=1 Tax=Fistulina hepatica ATCC 64428 TaxID=1128425 RepID=A0A0D7AB31_9AGAR|nr:hypothetical protein FISHEDRAFT_59233 [Fistulina hepatica ATCC 64428]
MVGSLETSILEKTSTNHIFPARKPEVIRWRRYMVMEVFLDDATPTYGPYPANTSALQGCHLSKMKKQSSDPTYKQKNTRAGSRDAGRRAKNGSWRVQLPDLKSKPLPASPPPSATAAPMSAKSGNDGLAPTVTSGSLRGSTPLLARSMWKCLQRSSQRNLVAVDTPTRRSKEKCSTTQGDWNRKSFEENNFRHFGVVWACSPSGEYCLARKPATSTGTRVPAATETIIAISGAVGRRFRNCAKWSDATRTADQSRMAAQMGRRNGDDDEPVHRIYRLCAGERAWGYSSNNNTPYIASTASSPPLSAATSSETLERLTEDDAPPIETTSSSRRSKWKKRLSRLRANTIGGGSTPPPLQTASPSRQCSTYDEPASLATRQPPVTPVATSFQAAESMRKRSSRRLSRLTKGSTEFLSTLARQQRNETKVTTSQVDTQGPPGDPDSRRPRRSSSTTALWGQGSFRKLATRTDCGTRPLSLQSSLCPPSSADGSDKVEDASSGSSSYCYAPAGGHALLSKRSQQVTDSRSPSPRGRRVPGLVHKAAFNQNSCMGVLYLLGMGKNSKNRGHSSSNNRSGAGTHRTPVLKKSSNSLESVSRTTGPSRKLTDSPVVSPEDLAESSEPLRSEELVQQSGELSAESESRESSTQSTESQPAGQPPESDAVSDLPAPTESDDKPSECQSIDNPSDSIVTLTAPQVTDKVTEPLVIVVEPPPAASKSATVESTDLDPASAGVSETVTVDSEPAQESSQSQTDLSDSSTLAPNTTEDNPHMAASTPTPLQRVTDCFGMVNDSMSALRNEYANLVNVDPSVPLSVQEEDVKKQIEDIRKSLLAQENGDHAQALHEIDLTKEINESIDELVKQEVERCLKNHLRPDEEKKMSELRAQLKTKQIELHNSEARRLNMFVKMAKGDRLVPLQMMDGTVHPEFPETVMKFKKLKSEQLKSLLEAYGDKPTEGSDKVLGSQFLLRCGVRTCIYYRSIVYLEYLVIIYYRSIVYLEYLVIPRMTRYDIWAFTLKCRGLCAVEIV